jgi:hypothetical protein
MPYRLTSLLTIYKALLASSSTRVYIYTGITTEVISRTRSTRVLLAIAAVHKVGICFGLQVLRVHNKGLSVI